MQDVLAQYIIFTHNRREYYFNHHNIIVSIKQPIDLKNL
jgi:hypothetical protein